MIQKLSTENGQCWAIILCPTNSLENVILLKDDLVKLLIATTQSSMFEISKNEFCSVLSLISEISPSQEQIEKLEAFLSPRAV